MNRHTPTVVAYLALVAGVIACALTLFSLCLACMFWGVWHCIVTLIERIA